MDSFGVKLGLLLDPSEGWEVLVDKPGRGGREVKNEN